MDIISNKIDELINNGSSKEELEIVKHDLSLLDLNLQVDELMNIIIEEIKEITYNFMNSKIVDGLPLVKGISTCIYIPRIDGTIKLKFISGKNNNEEDIDEDTLFDVASISKTFTLLLVFRLNELGFLDLNSKVSDLDKNYGGLLDYTILDLLKMTGLLGTEFSIETAKDKEEADKFLNTIYLRDKDKSKHEYADLGMIVISKLIEKIVSAKLNKSLTYSEIMDIYLIKPFKLNKTTFNPTIDNLAGNGNKLKLVHDPKSRVMGGAVGSAGIFTNNDDLAVIANQLFDCNIINLKHLQMIYKRNFKDWNRGLAGVFLKQEEGKGFTPLIYSDSTFTSQGFTGSTSTFDLLNKINNSILVNTIRIDAPKKIDGYLDEFKKYQKLIARKIFEILIIKECKEIKSFVKTIKF